MKRTTHFYYLVLCLLLLSTAIGAQPAGTYSSDEILLRFAPSATTADKVAILNQYNLEIIDGPTPVTQFLLCQIGAAGFPTLPPGSYQNVPDSISGVIVTMDNLETDVDGIGLNYSVFPPSNLDSTLPESNAPYAPLDGCAEEVETPNFNLDIPVMGDNIYKAGVFDTGMAGESLPNGFFLAHNALFAPHLAPNDIGENFVTTDPYPTDGNGHGTHMASLFVEDADGNTFGGQYPVQLLIYKTHGDQGSGKMFDIVAGIDEGILKNVRIANCSFTYYAPAAERTRLSNPLRIAMKTARQQAGTLFIAAAGNHTVNNDGGALVAFPASFPIPNLISVAALDCDGELAAYSNYGPNTVDLAAPGDRIVGAFLSSQYASLTGTSPAAALVSRVAAMLASHQATFDFRPIKCALLSGVGEDASLLGMVLSDGYLDAEKAYSNFVNNPLCDFGGGNGGGGNNNNGGNGNGNNSGGSGGNGSNGGSNGNNGNNGNGNNGGGGGPDNGVNNRRAATPTQTLTLDAHSTAGSIQLLIDSPTEGRIDVQLYNVVGQRLHRATIDVMPGQNQYGIEWERDDHPNLYLIEVNDSRRRQVVSVLH
ncbi:MAG: S8 family serine peptidase [Bacteroidota bacterium]